jgi:hypothetical protein
MENKATITAVRVMVIDGQDLPGSALQQHRRQIACLP